jgi:hypothetical protein
MVQEKIYRIPRSQAEYYRRSAIIYNVAAALVTFFVPLIAGELRRSHGNRLPFPENGEETLLFALAYVPLGLLLAGIIWWNVHKARTTVEQLLSLEIVVDANLVTKRQSGALENSLLFREISRVEEYRAALVVRSRSGQMMQIPARLEDLDELKGRILAASGAELVSKKTFWTWEMVPVAGFLASLMILMFASRLSYLRAAALYVIVFLLIGAVQMFRRPGFRPTRKAGVTCGLVLLLLIAVARAIPLWPF